MTRSILMLATAICLAVTSGNAFAIPIPLSEKMGPNVPGRVGTGLFGEYYDRTPADNDDVVSFAASNPADGTFIGTQFRYFFGGSNIEQGLAVDGPSLTGGNTDDQNSISLLMRGIINIQSSYDLDPGTAGIQVDFWSGEDDGGRIAIGGVNIVDNNGFSGFPSTEGSMTADFPEEGQYPIELIFFEGGGGEEYEVGSSILTGINGDGSNPFGTGGVLALNDANGDGVLFLEAFDPPEIPEPSTIVLFGLAVGGGCAFSLHRRRRQRREAQDSK